MGQERKPVYSIGLWLILWLLLLFILLKGHFAHTVVGDLGQPAWDFGAVPDIPGESPYAIYPSLPDLQHVKGQKGE
jgi:hypothetical protein